MKLRRGICYVLVGLSCLIQMGGCLPFLPGAFAMMCMEGGRKSWLLLATIVGLASAVPWLEAIRYMITVFILLIGSLVLEKTYGRKDSLHMAILSFFTVFLVGAGGEFMGTGRMGLVSLGLEALFAFGIILTFNRFAHWFLMPKEKMFVTREIPEEERKKKVSRYVEACEKLAEVFAMPQYEYASVQNGEAKQVTPVESVLGQSRMAISQQLLAIASNIEKCTTQEVYLCQEDRNMLRTLEYELKENGILGREFSVFEDEKGRHQVEFLARTMAGQNISLRSLSEMVSVIIEKPMSPREDMKTFLNREERKVVFIETGKFQVLEGHQKRAGQEERICGDNEFFLSINEGRVKACGISDGMGRGPTAAKESELVLDVAEELLNAGFLPEQALPMLNSACALRGEEKGCSTLDLCMIDTFTGLGSWYKMGAAASFLRREGNVEILYGNTLPVGAVEHAAVLKQERQLQNKDVIVMMTDGVLEALPSEHPEEMMKEIISEIEEDIPGNMATAIMQAVNLVTRQQIRDDMLVGVLRIWER